MLQCLYSVKPGVATLLDVSRTTFEGCTEGMELLVAHYRETLDLPDLKLTYSQKRGYYLTLPIAQKASSHTQDAAAAAAPAAAAALSRYCYRVRCLRGELASLDPCPCFTMRPFVWRAHGHV